MVATCEFIGVTMNIVINILRITDQVPGTCSGVDTYVMTRQYSVGIYEYPEVNEYTKNRNHAIKTGCFPSVFCL